MDTRNTKTDKIFIVDDDEMMAMIYQRHLENLGYTDVTIFTNGFDVQQALTDEPDIVFLDQQMEDLSGIEVLRKIKRFDPNIYVVFVSGQEDMDTAIRSMKVGAFDYIVKGDGDTDRMSSVLRKINHVRELLTRRDPSKLGKILTFLI